ncbi:MAG: fructose-1,6-bisphosphatase [Candidatus Izemoplasma sp.]
MKNNYESKYLNLLSKEFPTVQSVSTELINLTAINNLPKGTEHFLTDIHGEYDIFNHFLKNGSGVIREKVKLHFPDLTDLQRNTLSFVIYYPKQMLKKYQQNLEREEYLIFVKKHLIYMIEIASKLSQKYTRSKIQKSLPTEFSYIIQELLNENRNSVDKQEYYTAIIAAIFKTRRERRFVIEMAYFIQRLTIDRLHIVGDIYDRGPNAHLVMNKIVNYHSLDIEWGNHDVLWMGAAAGSEVCIANVLRNTARYNNLDTLEDGYGINLLPLASLADKYYRTDSCEHYYPGGYDGEDVKATRNNTLVAKIHKAITIIQFKLEMEVIKRNPNFEMDDRLLLEKINYDKGFITIDGVDYILKDNHFPTVNKTNPYQLNKDEIIVMNQLKNAFLNNDLLQKHVLYLFRKGSLYLKYNNNLLFHGSIPIESDGTFSKMEIDGNTYYGKRLFDMLEKKIRIGFLNRNYKINNEKDYFIFLWQGAKSPLFGKSSMKTLERYLLNDKLPQVEDLNYYFKLREDKTILKAIYDEFDINWDTSKIINGHVPLDITKGFMPVLANRRIYSIDGGMSNTYRSRINIGGYTLVIDSYSIFLVSHERFTTVNDLIEREEDIISLVQSEEVKNKREYIYNTDKGERLIEQIEDLYKLLEAYRSGKIKETIKS